MACHNLYTVYMCPVRTDVREGCLLWPVYFLQVGHIDGDTMRSGMFPVNYVLKLGEWPTRDS